MGQQENSSHDETHPIQKQWGDFDPAVKQHFEMTRVTTFGPIIFLFYPKHFFQVEKTELELAFSDKQILNTNYEFTCSIYRIVSSYIISFQTPRVFHSNSSSKKLAESSGIFIQNSILNRNEISIPFFKRRWIINEKKCRLKSFFSSLYLMNQLRFLNPSENKILVKCSLQ